MWALTRVLFVGAISIAARLRWQRQQWCRTQELFIILIS